MLYFEDLFFLSNLALSHDWRVVDHIWRLLSHIADSLALHVQRLQVQVLRLLSILATRALLDQLLLPGRMNRVLWNVSHHLGHLLIIIQHILIPYFFLIIGVSNIHKPHPVAVQFERLLNGAIHHFTTFIFKRLHICLSI